MSYHLFLPLRLLFTFLASTSILGISIPANAAQSIVFKYLILQETLSVSELTTFAETGEVSHHLQFYLGATEDDQEQNSAQVKLRDALTQEVKIDGVLLYRALNNPAGELLLNKVSQIIRTPSNRANVPSLRSALVTSALEDNQITLLEVLQNYPTSEVVVEGERLVEAVEELNNMSQTIEKLKGVIDNLPDISI
ncbi:MAG: alpha/beta hydrolase [Symploca sp. SIO1B1]|nr:alpha/beta hydrolase [Symploca sp. SIO1B1]